jgi:hypothetical protein
MNTKIQNKIKRKVKPDALGLRFRIVAISFASVFFPSISLAQWEIGDPIIPTHCFRPVKEATEKAGCGFDDLILMGSNIMSFLIYLMTITAVIAFVWAGWLYISAQGDQSQIKKAHGIFTTVALGIFITLGAWMIVNTLLTFLGVGPEYSLLR